MQPRTQAGRRASGLLLAALFGLGVAATPDGVLGDEPSVSASPVASPSVEPSVQSVEPSVEPLPVVTPTTVPEPSVDPTPDPSLEPTVPGAGDDAQAGRLDPTGRYIVVLDRRASVDTILDRQRLRGVRAIDVYRSAVRGFVARLDPAQRSALAADPAVTSIVPDEVVSIQQSTPTGVRRIYASSNGIANIDGVDDRVDADIAIVDTGVDATHPDLNVVGGINCSTSNPAAWRDVHGHGTHVAGIAAARDDPGGLVGVAPGARLWAVKILNDSGFGYLSWYVCGLDWIAAQRDPTDPTLPLIEVANMSVAKSGSDDGACGSKNGDILHAGICRLTQAGVTIVAAAGNDSSSAAAWVPAAYNEVITVSALADTDGKPGGLGGNLCYSWGSYDKDDTFANFSNYGSDVDLIAPGKCIKSTMPGGTSAYMSGTSMATPHVSGAVALYKASRPAATPADVRDALIELGTLDWKVSTDPDSRHEKLLDVSRLGPLGSFDLTVRTPRVVSVNDDTMAVGVDLIRTSTFFERVRLSADVPDGWTATFDDPSLIGFVATSTQLHIDPPAGGPDRREVVTVTAQHGSIVRTATIDIAVAQLASTSSSVGGGSGGSGGGSGAGVAAPTENVAVAGGPSEVAPETLSERAPQLESAHTGVGMGIAVAPVSLAASAPAAGPRWWLILWSL
jgi:subtilisin family serine protease